MGGINSTIRNDWLTTVPTMIIGQPYAPNFHVHSQTFLKLGADVSHPSPGSNLPSISALVFTPDRRYCSEYFAISSVQESRQEIIADFASMLEVSRKTMLDITKGLP